MTFRNVKTLLFASLIVAMVLPFSSIQMVQAEKSFEEKQQRLIDKVIRLDERIANNPGDQVKIDKLEAKKQRVLERLFNNVNDENDDTENATVETKRPTPQKRSHNSPTTPSYNIFINGVHKGCDNINETWNFKAAADRGDSRITVMQSFPSQLTTGNAPNCSSWDWQNNLYLQFEDIFVRDKKCMGNLITNPSTSYSIMCGGPLEGFWVVKLTADYEFHQVTGFTYVFL